MIAYPAPRPRVDPKRQENHGGCIIICLLLFKMTVFPFFKNLERLQIWIAGGFLRHKVWVPFLPIGTVKVSHYHLLTLDLDSFFIDNLKRSQIFSTTHDEETRGLLTVQRQKGVVLALGALGAASMWEAVFADVGVTLLAVLNVLRILRTGKVFPPGSRRKKCMHRKDKEVRWPLKL